MASATDFDRPLRVTHVISGLEIGGAERVLQRLCQQHRRAGLLEPSVVSLSAIGPIGEALLDEGFTVRALGLGKSTSPLRAIGSLRAALRDLRPDVVQSWLYHADLLSGLALRGSGLDAPLAWNLRCTVPGRSLSSRSLFWLNALLSRAMPTSIVCCGEAAQSYHAARGYDRARMTVIPNGFEVDRFVPPVRPVRDRVDFLAIGRDDPLKGYPLLLRAFAEVARTIPQAFLTIRGKGIDSNLHYRELAASLGIAERVSFGESVADVRPHLAEADIYCSSSNSEGFPNVIGEAMLMELPCAVTDAGDSAMLVGPAGLVSPVGQVSGLAASMIALGQRPSAERAAMGKAARERIANEFSIETIARRYAEHYHILLDRD